MVGKPYAYRTGLTLVLISQWELMIFTPLNVVSDLIAQNYVKLISEFTRFSTDYSSALHLPHSHTLIHTTTHTFTHTHTYRQNSHQYLVQGHVHMQPDPGIKLLTVRATAHYNPQ